MARRRIVIAALAVAALAGVGLAVVFGLHATNGAHTKGAPATKGAPTKGARAPQPLVIREDGRVVDGGRYESVTVDGASNVTVRNVTIDNSGYDGNPLQLGADCAYLKGVGNVTIRDSKCVGAHRQGVAIVSTKANATVTLDHVTIDPRRYTVDLEPNTPTQKIGNVRLLHTTSSGGFGWLVYPCGGIVQSVYSLDNTSAGQRIPDGSLTCGRR
jgi:hypothetical protein